MLFIWDFFLKMGIHFVYISIDMISTKQLIPIQFHNDPKTLKSLSLIVTLNILIMIVAGIFAPLLFHIGFNEGGWIMTYTSIGALAYIVILNLTRNLFLCGTYFMLQSLFVTIILMVYTGGVSSPFLLWIFAMCPVSFLYFKKRVANFWVVLICVCFLVITVLQILGFPFEQHLPDKYFYGSWGFMFSFVVFVFVSMVQGFQNGLKKSNKKLKTSNQELERFAYIASHDLKSPLKNISSFTRLFNKKYDDQLDAKGKEFLQIIASNAEQMHHLIEDILEYSQTNSREVKKEKVDLNNILNQLSIQLLNEEQYCQSQIDFCNLPILESDYTLIKQVFQNLVENGLKYNDSEQKKIEIIFQESKNNIQFLIRDNGIGMEEKYYDQIFEMFKRLHTGNEYNGTGIGLAICKKMVLQLGGEIRLTSKVNEGSTFYLIFPKTMLWQEIAAVEEEEMEEIGMA